MSADRYTHTHQLMSYELVYTSIHSSINVLLGLWLRLECSLDSLSIVSTDHQIDRGLSVSLRLYEMCHVLVIV